jgi:hypothetical protein
MNLKAAAIEMECKLFISAELLLDALQIEFKMHHDAISTQM